MEWGRFAALLFALTLSACSYEPLSLDTLRDPTGNGNTNTNSNNSNNTNNSNANNNNGSTCACAADEVCVEEMGEFSCTCGPDSALGEAACSEDELCTPLGCNGPPVVSINGGVSPIGSLGAGNVTLTAEALDPDDDLLFFTWTVNPPCTLESGLGESLVVSAPPNVDQRCLVELEVDDGTFVVETSVEILTVDRGTHVRPGSGACVTGANTPGGGSPDMPWCSLDDAFTVAADTGQVLVRLYDEPINADGLVVPDGIVLAGGYVQPATGMPWVQSGRTSMSVMPSPDGIQVNGALRQAVVGLTGACATDCALLTLGGIDSSLQEVSADASVSGSSDDLRVIRVTGDRSAGGEGVVSLSSVDVTSGPSATLVGIDVVGGSDTLDVSLSNIQVFMGGATGYRVGV
ncbi:MAG: hypothetical protein AAFY60_06790, partial [Myxococcota bacterium]